jgi:hypothetical protein
MGLDLGQAQEFTALAVLERWQGDGIEAFPRSVNYYAVRHLERFAMGTPFTEVVARVVELFWTRDLSGSTLVMDQTVVGQPVVQMFRRAGINARIRPVAVTSGQKATKDKGVWLIPRKELVSTLQVLLQARRIKVSPALPDAQLLVQELMNFKAKPVTATDDTLESWREGPHDDLVLAVAIAAWEGEHYLDWSWWLGWGRDYD